MYNCMTAILYTGVDDVNLYKLKNTGFIQDCIDAL